MNIIKATTFPYKGALTIDYGIPSLKMMSKFHSPLHLSTPIHHTIFQIALKEGLFPRSHELILDRQPLASGGRLFHVPSPQNATCLACHIRVLVVLFAIGQNLDHLLARLSQHG